MKKTAFALVAASCASTGALAQSVTVFGVMDLAARVVSNEGVGSIKSLVSGANQTSRLGVRGTEDLGGGLGAGFWIESTIAADAGVAGQSAPAGQFWDRRATVSLSSASIGEVRLGRDYVPSYVSWSRFDPFGHVGAANAGNLVSATPQGPLRAAFGGAPNTTARSSNAVQYLIPTDWGNWQGGVMLAAGEGGTAANGQHKLTGVRLGYAASQFVVSAAVTVTQNNVTGSEKLTDAVVGGSYDFGVVRLSGALRQFKLINAKQQNLLIGLVAPVGAGAINASYQRANGSGSVGAASTDNVDANQFGVGYVHYLSKRSALFATYARIDNKSAAAYTVPGGASGMAAGGTSSALEGGFRHSF